MQGFSVVWCLVLLVALSQAKPDRTWCCRFAEQYTDKELLYEKTTRDDFIANAAYSEGFFHSAGISFHGELGITYDGHPLNYTTGFAANSVPHQFTASSKESLHVSMLARAIAGDKNAQLFVNNLHPENATATAVEILTKKIATYEAFNNKYPGYGGYLPWVYVYDSGLEPTSDFVNRVPALDNGQLVWSLFVLVHVLEERGITDLQARYRRHLDMMIANSMMIFYEGDGKIRAVTRILNMTATPTPSNYVADSQWWLDDPYEGELMAFFLDLFGNWQNASDRDEVWVFKRTLLQRVDYVSKSYGNITVQRGWWFSAHEQWKLLMLPYLKVPIARRVFENCERARTIHSMENEIPGLYASVNDVTNGSIIIPDYISATGIQSIAFELVQRRDILTPYGAYPAILVNQPVGLVWYHRMLLGPRMQGRFGSTEGVNINGTEISPLVTWDSKITTMLAMLGGTQDLAERFLKKIPSRYNPQETLYDRFHFVVHREHTLVFSNLSGEAVPFGLPVNYIPTDDLGYFPACHC